jgi:fructose-1,6-bisphosphatase I
MCALPCESKDTELITLSRHVLGEQQAHPDACGDFTLLLMSIQVACKFISSQVRRAGLANLYACSAQYPR